MVFVSSHLNGHLVVDEVNGAMIVPETRNDEYLIKPMPLKKWYTRTRRARISIRSDFCTRLAPWYTPTINTRTQTHFANAYEMPSNAKYRYEKEKKPHQDQRIA